MWLNQLMVDRHVTYIKQLKFFKNDHGHFGPQKFVMELIFSFHNAFCNHLILNFQYSIKLFQSPCF